MNKQPEVTARTRAALICAFWKLYRDCPVEKIRIDALTKEAGYNRTTFYEYFTDIYDIRQQAEDELFEECRTKMFSLLPDGVRGSGKEDIVKALVTVFDAYGDRIMILTGERGDTSFRNRMEEQAMPLMRRMLGADAGECTNYIISFVYNAIAGVLQYWCRNGKEMPEEQLLSLIYSMMYDGTMKTVMFMSGQ
ncbi:MAG: TetR/AcrR family transcriptional regulator [Clostridia bacterium]|nr:TetR/AcrR family transcriptional regulator [Clostridia bacterium]